MDHQRELTEIQSNNTQEDTYPTVATGHTEEEEQVLNQTEKERNVDVYASSLGVIPKEQRTWRFWHYASIWAALSISLPTYMMGSGMLSTGLNWWESALTIFLGNIISIVPLVLNGHAGTKYGIPFPVLARVSFGTRGAIIVAVLFRGLAGVCWFGFQALVGGRCLYLAIVSLLPARIVAYYIIPLQMGSFMNDMNLLQFVCFLLFIILNTAIVWGPSGMSRVKNLETVAAPSLLLSSIALFIWALVLVPFPIILETSYKMSNTIKNGKSNIIYLFAHLTAVIGGWSTMILNIVDFTRYALTQKDQVIGQTMGLPLVMTSFAFIGICVTSAAFKIYGQVIWNPVDLFSKFQNPFVACLSSLILALAITAGNLTANLVSAANDFCNLNPRLISFKIASLITALLSILIMPWKLFATAEGFISIFLVGTSGILGSIAGIMISDYYLIHARELSLPDLYSLNSESSYYYTLGFSVSAFSSFIISIIPIIPGFIYQLGVERMKRAFPNWILSIYDYAWFITFLLASIMHLLSKLVFHTLLDKFREHSCVIQQQEEQQQQHLDDSSKSNLNESTCFSQINNHV